MSPRVEHDSIMDEELDANGTVGPHDTDRAPNAVTDSDRAIAEGITQFVVPQVGDRIGRFILQEKLGQGVSCFVFRGWDELDQLPVAVKIVNWGNVVDRDAALKQMRTESAALARVKHPKILRFIDFGIDPRFPYLITEFLDGRSLGELVRTGGALPVAWSVYLISQIADGLGAVWRAGQVHRDIKPDNILVGPNGVAKLIDFGLAKQTAGPKGSSDMAGTAAYLAPEQAKDASLVDHRADIYSLGVTFFEVLTGQLPFEGKNKMQMIYHHLNTEPPKPIEINPEVPGIVNDLCLWMMKKIPDERPQTSDDLRMAFDSIMGM